MAWRNRFKKDKACKKISKELMSVHSTQQDDGICACQKTRKRNRTIFDL